MKESFTLLTGAVLLTSVSCGTKNMDTSLDVLTSTGVVLSTTDLTYGTQSSPTGDSTAGWSTTATGSRGETSESTGLSESGSSDATDGGGSNTPCETWNDMCPDEAKCNPYFMSPVDDQMYNAMACFPLWPEPDMLGDACSGIEFDTPDLADSCGRGLLCYDGTCHLLCQGELPDLACSPGQACIHSIYPLAVCMDICDPLAPDCDAGEVCSYGYSFVYLGGVVEFFRCVPPLGEKPVFELCVESAECAEGLTCMSGEVSSECDDGYECCNALCDVSMPNLCPGIGQACVPFFSPPSKYPEYDQLGYCSVQ